MTQATFEMTEAELMEIYYQELEKVVLARFKAGEGQLCIRGGKHLLPSSSKGRSLCHAKKYKCKAPKARIRLLGREDFLLRALESDPELCEMCAAAAMAQLRGE